jgi:two-component system, LytTR family, sensor kinase
MPTEPSIWLLRERSTWIVVVGFWSTYGVVSWGMKYASSFLLPDGPISIWRAADRVPFATLWCIGSFVAIAAGNRFTVTRYDQYGRILLHFVGGIAVGVGFAVAAYYVNLALIPGWLPLGVPRMIYTAAGNLALGYWMILVLVHAFIYAQRYRLREIEALREARLHTEAQLHALKMELQPHFLFNTLNSVSALMLRDVKAANRMLVMLSDMLHDALANVRHQEVSLGEEVETLRQYVQIEQMRFEDRLRFEWNLDPDTLSARVPHLILQPLVENAIRHGIGSRTDSGRIEVTARRVDDRLELSVRDDGYGFHGVQPTPGLGLTNTRERLIQLYGDAHRFELTDAPGGGALVTIRLPFVEMTEDATLPTVERQYAGAHPSADRG